MSQPETAGLVRGDPERTRRLILEAALVEFAENGFGGSRVDKIARAAGVNKQALYYHFGNKDELFGATLEYGYKRIRQVETTFSSPAANPREEMAGIVRAFFDSMNENRHAGALISEENRLGGRHLLGSRQTKEVTLPFVRRITAVYRDGVGQGVFRPGIDPEQLWISIVAMVQLYFTNIHTLSHILNRNFSEEDEIAGRRAHVVELVLAAIRG